MSPEAFPAEEQKRMGLRDKQLLLWEVGKGLRVTTLLPHLSTAHLFRGNLGPSMEDCPEHTLVAGRSDASRCNGSTVPAAAREQPSHIEGGTEVF